MRYLLYLTLLLSTSLQAGAIHKWVDDDGNVHYGDAPPVSATTEPVRVQSAPSNPGKALPRLSSPEASGSDATAPAADAPGISRSSRIKLRAADGTTRYMSTEEIDERKQQAEADVKQFCK
jgi:hypothetical protein